MRLNVLLTLFLFPLYCLAELPPSDFMSLEVGVLRQYGSTSGYGFKLQQFHDTLKNAGGSREWKKDNPEQWTYVVKTNDNATGNLQRLAIVFKKDGKFASVIRYVDNDKEVKQKFLGSAVDQLMIPISQVISQSGGSANPKSTSFPSSEFLNLKISTTDDGGNSTTHKWTVQDLVKHLESKGMKVSWTKNEDGVSFLKANGKGKPVSIGFYQDNNLANGNPMDESNEKILKILGELK